jgi:lipoprotein-releasing system permease protein
MRFPFFIAKRYLISRKKAHAINIISGISVAGVVVGTFALVLVLSVFNGFDQLVQSMFSSFDPELVIHPSKGKRFAADTQFLEQLDNVSGIDAYAKTVEENVLLKYNEKTHPARMKAVDEQYMSVTGLDTMIIHKAYDQPKNNNFCIVGQALGYHLGVSLNFLRSMTFYVPDREAGMNVQAHNAFQSDYLIPSAVFTIRQEVDERYVIVPFSFAQKLFNSGEEVSAIEIKTTENSDPEEVKLALERVLGSEYVIKTRYEQHEFFYKVMKSEKWAIFFILSFILIIASFNILGSLTMLIIDKKKDVFILQSLGADNKIIKQIFFTEGVLITAVGAFVGVFLGFVVALLQETYGIIKIQGEGVLIIDAYPVQIQALDFVWVIAVVGVIGFIASWFPTQLLAKRILRVN